MIAISNKLQRKWKEGGKDAQKREDLFGSAI
jgi:hypothetical protein